jgi:hypothetical protein
MRISINDRAATEAASTAVWEATPDFLESCDASRWHEQGKQLLGIFKTENRRLMVQPKDGLTDGRIDWPG